MTLKWQRGANGALYGFSGEINRAQVTECAGPRHWKWELFGTAGANSHGYCKTAIGARRAAERAWSGAVIRGALTA